MGSGAQCGVTVRVGADVREEERGRNGICGQRSEVSCPGV